jgi:hypothetical protein
MEAPQLLALFLGLLRGRSPPWTEISSVFPAPLLGLIHLVAWSSPTTAPVTGEAYRLAHPTWATGYLRTQLPLVHLPQLITQQLRLSLLGLTPRQPWGMWLYCVWGEWGEQHGKGVEASLQQSSMCYSRAFRYASCSSGVKTLGFLTWLSKYYFLASCLE